jgi:tetratricopeptide (TPR) repeat protein
LAIGSIHTSTLAVVTVFLSATAAVAWAGAAPKSVRPEATLLLLVCAALTAYTTAQCIPLPVSALALLAPRNADVWARSLQCLGEAGPAYASISLDPVASRVEVMKGIAYGAAFLATLRVAARRDGALFLTRAVVVSSLALAGAAIVHPALGAHKVFGLYQPIDDVSARHIAPLLNPNHLAEYINVGICCSLAIGLTADTRAGRFLPLGAALALVATQIWIASRAGTASMVLGALLVPLVLNLRARTSDRTLLAKAAPIATAAAAVLGAGLIVVGSADESAGELFTSDVSKLDISRAALRMLGDYGVFGVGRGAFQEVFPRYRDSAGHKTFTSPENFLAQWSTEWGPAVTLVAVACIAVALAPRVSSFRTRVTVGPWASLCTLVVQNLVDFGSEVPGIMVTASICAGIVVAGTNVDSHPGRLPRLGRWWTAPRAVVAGVGLAGLVAAALGLTSTHGDVASDRAALYTALRAPAPRAATHNLVRSAIRRHPSEPYLPFAVGLRASIARDENPLPWLGATLERARVYGPAHLVVARTVRTQSRSQARFEYRVALEQDPDLFDIVRAEAFSLVDGFDDALELVPSDGRAGAMLESLAVDLSPRLPATAARLDEMHASLVPGALGPAIRATADAVADLMAGEDASWCTGLGRPSCVHRAVDLATALERKDPTSCTGYAFEAKALAAGGDPIGAKTPLDRADEQVTDRRECLRASVELGMAANDDRRVETALEGILGAGCSSEDDCRRDYVYVGEVRRARGNLPGAIAIFRRARERFPDDDWLLEQVAVLAANLGLHQEAAEHYEKLSKVHPSEPRWADAAANERRLVLRGLVEP